MKKFSVCYISIWNLCLTTPDKHSMFRAWRESWMTLPGTWWHTGASDTLLTQNEKNYKIFLHFKNEIKVRILRTLVPPKKCVRWYRSVDDPDNQIRTPPVSFLDIDHPDKLFSIFMKDIFNQYFLRNRFFCLARGQVNLLRYLTNREK